MTQSLKKHSLLGLHTQDFSFQHIWDLTNYITSEKKGGSDNYNKGRGDQKGKSSNMIYHTPLKICTCTPLSQDLSGPTCNKHLNF